MIILDENVYQQRIQASVASWYGGQVRSITTLRPNTLIKDDAIPSLLLLVRQPTFVTTNVDDFWRRMSAHSRFSMVCMALPNEHLHEPLYPTATALATLRIQHESEAHGQNHPCEPKSTSVL
jgi:hypothetical protein